ncbi:MAG: glucose-6-phosphate isomerase [Clostridia bacterium]|nr:glucose-6-phosphate isomerase [Clostridia bacterium]MBQ7352365.1 glucose-6-phosphate isomerase [Clostridia bacterium]
MKLEYYGVAKGNLKNGLSLSTIPATNRNRFIKNIASGKASNMLDWINLPDMKEKDILEIESVAKSCNHMTDFVVLGIGGSALGIKLLKHAFVDSLHKNPKTKVTVCDNIDGDSMVSFLDSLNLKKTMFNVITKSGSTSETLTQMMIVIDRFKKKKIDYTKHFVVTTTEGIPLWNWAVSNGIPVLPIAKGVGGRYSILSAVGLLPARVMGLDIRGLLSGAKKSRENSFKADSSNIAYNCAYINHCYLKEGLTNLVTMPYSDRLAYLPEFFAQLWAESLGKKHNREGKVVYAGQTPIRALGVTDQHSQLQLYSEGIKDKLIMFVRVEKPQFDEKVEEALPFTQHLTGTTFNTLLDYEYNATAYALTSQDRPNYTLAIDVVNENTMGELIFMLEMMTAFMGEMLDVDAYDQPGVELGKIYTRAMLGVKVDQESAKAIKTYMKDKKKFII